MELLRFLFRGSSRKNKIYSVINSVIRCPFERVFLLLHWLTHLNSALHEVQTSGAPGCKGSGLSQIPSSSTSCEMTLALMEASWRMPGLKGVWMMGRRPVVVGSVDLSWSMWYYIKSHATCLKLKVHMHNFLNPPLPFKPRLYFFWIRFKIYRLVAVSF